MYKTIVLDYNKFLENKSDNDNTIIMSDNFKEILSRIKNEISRYILDLDGSDGQITYIDSTGNKESVSFLLTRNVNNVIKKGNDPWKASARQDLKIGRFANKITNSKFPKKEIESFVNQYKASYMYDDFFNRFDVVEGKDVTKYYHCSNQKSGGNLSKSCMGISETRPYIRSFFESNPQTMKMLILRDKEEPEYIIGRANLWFLTEPKDRIFMDRIYTNEDYLTNIFIQYAIDNNFIYKSRQIYGGSVLPVIDNGVRKKLIMKAFMKPIDYEYYPYVDTLQFYNKKTGEITNDVNMWDITDNDEWIGLLHAGGNYLTKDNDQGFKMDYLGRLVHPYFVKWSKIDNCYIHTSDAVYLAYKNDYCIPERDYVTINGQNYLKEDTYFDGKEYKVKK